MTKMVLGLFDDAGDAQASYKELLAAGFERSEIDVVGNRGESTLTLDMLPMQIPEPDVQFYQERVRQYQQTNTNARLRDYDETQGDVVLPVIEEELQVGKRQVERGRMRVYTRISERPVAEQVTLRDETVHIERRPVDLTLSQADAANAFQQQSIEMTETGEEAVVSKTARVVEEVRIDKETSERTETVRDSVRHTIVDVENIEAQAAASGDSSAVERSFRCFYQKNYGQSGRSYDEYAPGFRYGDELGGDTRWQGKWSTVEANARRDWEAKNPGSWEQFKDSIRYAWEQARGWR